MLRASAAHSSCLRRVLVTLAALAVYRLGSLVPLPGVDVEVFFDNAQPLAGNPLARVSIFALGLSPALFVLVCAEAIKLLFEPLQRWEAASAANRDRLALILRLFILLFVGLQAWQLAWGLEVSQGLVHEPGLPFEIGIIATLVGGTALLLWLADLITRQGLGPGFWLLWLVPYLSGLGNQFALLREALRVGAVTPFQVAAGVLWLAALGLVILTLAKARFGRSLLRPDGTRASIAASLTRSPVAFDVAPLFASALVSGLIISFATRYLPREPGSLAWDAADVASIAFFFAFFYFLRARAGLALAPLRGEPADRAAAFRQAWMTAAALIVLFVSNALLPLYFRAFAVYVVAVLVAADIVETLAGYVPQKVR